MRTRQFLKFAAASVLTLGAAHAQAAIALFEFGINVDGITWCNQGPCDNPAQVDLGLVAGVDDSGFNFGTGLGTVTMTIGAAGGHNVVLFLDHEIDQTNNTFFNEFGDTGGGAPAVGQSWEIDEPGFVFGDIYNNFLAGTLDNSNGVPGGAPDDVSMAMGFDFILAAGETATMMFVVGDAMPGGFFLSHTDPDSNETYFFSASLDIDGGPVVPAPEPASLLLLGVGLAQVLLLAVHGKRRAVRWPSIVS